MRSARTARSCRDPEVRLIAASGQGFLSRFGRLPARVEAKTNVPPTWSPSRLPLFG